MSERKTIVSCAVTGNVHTREQNPNLPITPKEIAHSVIEAERAGAAIAHIHVRDPETGLGSMELSLYQEVVERVQDAGSNIILNLTTGEGGRFIPSHDDPRKPAVGTTLCAPELRVQHVQILRPEVCTLDLNTMNSGRNVVINTPRNVEIMANLIQEAGVIPELEIFDTGDLNLALDLCSKGILKQPLMFQLVLGIKFGAAADPQTLMYLVSRLPEGSNWGAFGVGRMSFPILAVVQALGGHVRVGMEDTLYIEKDELVRSNGQLVDRAVEIVQKLGGAIATPEEAREILRIPVRADVG